MTYSGNSSDSKTHLPFSLQTEKIFLLDGSFLWEQPLVEHIILLNTRSPFKFLKQLKLSK